MFNIKYVTNLPYIYPLKSFASFFVPSHKNTCNFPQIPDNKKYIWGFEGTLNNNSEVCTTIKTLGKKSIYPSAPPTEKSSNKKKALTEVSNYQVCVLLDSTNTYFLKQKYV